jgi:hypothetical protein
MMRQSTSWLLALFIALMQLAGCQRRPPFNPSLAGRFFPLRSGLSWRYQITYRDGVHATITDRVLKGDQTGTLRSGATIVSDYSDQGSWAVRAELSRAYPTSMTELETRYVVNGGYITRIAILGGPNHIALEEHGFLPQYLWPNRIWSNTLSPFDHFAGNILKISQNHRAFLEDRELVVPAGRFSNCIRIETEASYHGSENAGHKRYFTDWYAPDVGLVKTIVSSGGQDGHEIMQIELVQFAKSPRSTPPRPPQRPSLVPLLSKTENQRGATAQH